MPMLGVGLQMQHQQFYKMVAYEASSRVPCVIAGPGVSPIGNVITLASLVDSASTFTAFCVVW